MRLANRKAIAVFSVLATLSLGACAKTSGDEFDDFGAGTAELVHADGWVEVAMHANYAKTQVDTAGHFETSHNGCRKEAWGALDLKTWNALAAATNKAIRKPALRQEEQYCLGRPEFWPYMDGNVELVMEDGSKRPLFENRGGEICSLIADASVATTLLDSLHRVVWAADSEDCPTARRNGTLPN